MPPLISTSFFKTRDSINSVPMFSKIKVTWLTSRNVSKGPERRRARRIHHTIQCVQLELQRVVHSLVTDLINRRDELVKIR